MIEDDIRKLSEQPSLSLDRLEADIWTGVDARIKARHMSRTVFFFQAAVAIALVASISAGTRATMAADPTPGLGVFSTHAELAPSTRLLGR